MTKDWHLGILNKKCAGLNKITPFMVVKCPDCNGHGEITEPIFLGGGDCKCPTCCGGGILMLRYTNSSSQINGLIKELREKDWKSVRDKEDVDKIISNFEGQNENT